LRPLAAGSPQERRMHQPEQRTIPGINPYRRVQMQAALITVIAQAGRVLDRQHMTAARQPGRARAGGRYHLLRRHAPVAQKATETDLPGSAAAERTDPNPGLANR